LPFTRKEIENNEPIPPLPVFSNFSVKKEEEGGEEYDDSEYEIPPMNLLLHKKFFDENKDQNLNSISTKKAIEMWKNNSINEFTIKQVAQALKPLERHGYLNFREFQVGNHLMSISNHLEIPVPLPNCLLKFLGRPLISNRGNQTKKKKVVYEMKYKDYLNINQNTNTNSNIKRNSFNNSNVQNRISEVNGTDIQKFNSDDINQEDIQKDDMQKDELKKSTKENSDKKNSSEKISLNSNKNEDGEKKDNDEMMMKLMERMDDLEKKNEEANKKIAKLTNFIEILIKNNKNLNKEVNELKIEVQNLKNQPKIPTNLDTNQNKNHKKLNTEVNIIKNNKSIQNSIIKKEQIKKDNKKNDKNFPSGNSNHQEPADSE